jgi:hypothetical protein
MKNIAHVTNTTHKKRQRDTATLLRDVGPSLKSALITVLEEEEGEG